VRLDGLACKLVGIDEDGPALDQHGGDGGLARTDSAGEPDRDQGAYTNPPVPPESRTVRLSRGALELGALAVLAYVPLLLTKPGEIASDTKQYLYLDPGRLIRQAISMWDPSTAAGTVTHQQIGYLLPMGPFYWLFAELGAPVWVAQRIWMGTLLFAAGAGVRYAVRVLGLTGPGVLIAGAVYELSPYTMQYLERISAILMPWAGLGWMVGFTAMAIRRGGWRYPALFALVVALAGGVNATSLLYAGLAPLAWLVYSVAVLREVRVGRAVAAALRIGVLSVVVSLWWIAGLVVEGAFGINVLVYTETVPAVASTSIASEVFRGLGYWFFYGGDRLGPWLRSAVEYEERLWLIAVSFAVPLLGVIGATVSRFRARAYFVLLGVLGLVLSVGTHPYTDPSIVGRGLRAFMTGTTAGFALRSTDRATPLLIFALAALLGAGLSALWGRLRFVSVAAAAVSGALVVANAAPLLGGLAVDPHFERNTSLPSYYAAAARYLDSHGAGTRALIEPGIDFADYTFGDTIDPVWPGIVTRPTLQRQQLIDGSDATADLLAAFDLQLQQGTYEPSTLAPIARLFSAGDVVLQSDYRYWHFNTPRPQETWALFDPPPPGVGRPVTFGPYAPSPTPAAYPMLDEEALAEPADAPWPPPVAIFPVAHARPIYRAEPAADPIVLDGSGDGVVAAAAAGLLADNPTILYAGTLDGRTRLSRQAIGPGAVLVLTDTNRKDLRHWASVRDNIGATETAVTQPQTPDPTAQPLEVFGHQRASAETVAGYTDARYVAASAYGNPVAFTPEDRPYAAFDGNPATAWSVAAFSPAPGNWLQVRLKRPDTIDHLDLSQVLGSSQNRWITEVTIGFDGRSRVTERLGQTSHTAAGEVVRFPPHTFQTLRITIDKTTWHGRSLAGAAGVGFSEVRIPGVHIFETMVMPSDLLDGLGRASLSHRLVILMTRMRVSPIPPRSDPEPIMSRSFVLPTARDFGLSGTARISALIPDNEIDTILGGPKVFGGAVIGSDERLPGDLKARAVMTLDGNPATFWGPGFDAQAQRGAWMEAALTHPVSFDHLNLQVIADGRHSVPTLLRITTNTGDDVLVQVPPIRDRKAFDAVVDVPLHFRQVTGSVIRFTVEKVREERTINWYSERPIVLPFAISSIGLPGVHFTPEDPNKPIFPLCRNDLLRIDGKPVWLKVEGTVGAAESGDGLKVTGCGPDRHGIRLSAGRHRLVTALGQKAGIDLDRLVLDSAAGGAALLPLADGDVPPVAGSLGGEGVAPLSAPHVKVLSAGSTHARLLVTGADRPFWLVLGESINKGWLAEIEGGRTLGRPVLVDGYANGWYVSPSKGSFVVDLTWTPQGGVDVALVVSAAAILLCLLLAFLPEPLRRRLRGRLRWRRRAPEAAASPPGPQSAEPEPLTGDLWPAAPRLAAPWGAGGAPARWRSAAVAGVTGGAITYLVLPPATALPAALALAAAVAVAARWRGFRGILTVAALGGAAAAGVLTVMGQALHHYPPGGFWPPQFETPGTFAFVALLALAGDAIVEIARSRSSIDRPAGRPPGPARRAFRRRSRPS
jgi:arabinofuranan 3-O-arabinosyltransferase